MNLNNNNQKDNYDNIDEEDGSYYYFKEDVLHRTDGPAVDTPGLWEDYYINGLRHRINGPARVNFEFPNQNEYWLHGKYIPDQFQYWYLVGKLKLKTN